MEYEVKYLRRLASVYMDKYDVHGHEVAKTWFKTFLNDELRKLIRPYITEEVQRRAKDKQDV